MRRKSRTIVGVLAILALVAGGGAPVTAGQDPGTLSERTWVAAFVSLDTDGGTASFRARASVGAIGGAERLTVGELVRFRWEGPERRRVHRIAEVTPLSTSRGTPRAATSRGRFAMNAQLLSVNRRARMLAFSVPIGSDWLEVLEEIEAGNWLAIRCEIDRQGQIAGIIAIDSLARTTARQ